MSPTMQALMTCTIVTIATGYTFVKFMPKAWRLRLAAAAATLATRVGLSDSASRRVEAKLASGGACGSCETCRSCATPARTEGAASALTVSTPSRLRQIPIRRA